MNNSILSPSYWRSATAEVKNLRRVIFAALVCALCIALSSLFIPVGENLRIKFSFFINAVGCAVYGPILGILTAIVSDTLGYILFPSGAYFPGYLLSAIAGNLIYALLLYRKKITVLRLFTAKFLVNYLVNVLMGSLWSQMLFGKGYLYYLVKSLIKNTLLLPLEVIVLAMVFALIIPAFARMGMLSTHSERALRKLDFNVSAFSVLGIDFVVSGICSFLFNRTLETPAMLYNVLGGIMIAIGIVLLIISLVRARRSEATAANS